MDFFSAQDDARKKTKWLIFLFVIGVLTLVILTNLFLNLLMAFGSDAVNGDLHQNISQLQSQFDWTRFLGVGALVVIVIFLGSSYRTMSLSKGGKSVAEMMGGRLVTGDTQNPGDRRLVNVVEEIAIASGTQVPLVYIMENEPGINAFAAGMTPSDAVVAVTRGCVDQLSRSELQGVIAHEFSHILNGDMRINMRLIGILFGILMIGLIGRFLMRSGFYSGSSRSRGNDKGLGLVGIGIGLAVLGYAGTFFGNWIKASISRQREYLADASAVQFTRNPDGIANALKKIGGGGVGSVIQHPDSAELSHAYFSNGLRSFFGSMFATHPPLQDRIKRIQPRWDGKFEVKPVQVNRQSDQTQSSAVDHKGRERMVATATILAGAMETINHAGQATPGNLQQASSFIHGLPDTIRQASYNPYAARALIYALVLHQDHALLTAQFHYLNEHADKGVAMLTEQLMLDVRALPQKHRLAVVDMSMPALRQLSDLQYGMFRNNFIKIIEMDDHISVFEWSLQKIVLHSLDIDFQHRPQLHSNHVSIGKLTQQCSVLLSFLARETQPEESAVTHAFRAAINKLDLPGVRLLPASELSLASLESATDKLAKLKPLQKPRLLKACAACIAADDKVTADEMELLRAFSSLLDCPMPMLPEGLN
jgi:Zn-dependent protease with chaperone function